MVLFFGNRKSEKKQKRDKINDLGWKREIEGKIITFKSLILAETESL